MLELGQKGRDKITGFEGILVSHVRYLTGCDQYGLTPTVGEDGKIRETNYFDESRIEIVGRGVLASEVQGETNGGPNRDAPR